VNAIPTLSQFRDPNGNAAIATNVPTGATGRSAGDLNMGLKGMV